MDMHGATEEFGGDYFMDQAEERIKKLEKRVDDLEGELERVKAALNIPDVCHSCGARLEEK